MNDCRSCHAPIIWAKTANGKAIPIDATPTSLGNIEVDGGTAKYVTADVNALGPRYVAHFATCPQANNYSRPKTEAAR